LLILKCLAALFRKDLLCFFQKPLAESTSLPSFPFVPGLSTAGLRWEARQTSSTQLALAKPVSQSAIVSLRHSTKSAIGARCAKRLIPGHIPASFPIPGRDPLRDGRRMNVFGRFPLIPHITKGLTPCSSFARKARIMLKAKEMAHELRLSPVLSTSACIRRLPLGASRPLLVGLRSKTLASRGLAPVLSECGAGSASPAKAGPRVGL
jgi:hypothetical protein